MMLNVCFECGLYRADKIIDASGPYAICPVCGYQHTFLYLPLLVVSGASGTGKSTVCNSLMGLVRQAVMLDSDILWHPVFNKPETNYRDFFELWLRVCKNIAQSGKPVVLFGAGVGVPDNLERCVERRYFSEIHYLALTCSDGTLSMRLQQRPAWRETSNPAYITEQIQFNQWFKRFNQTGQHPPITLLDTTDVPSEKTADQVAEWINTHIHSPLHSHSIDSGESEH